MKPKPESKISWCVFDLPTQEDQLAQLEQASQAPDLWDHPETAQSLMQRMSRIRRDVDRWHELRQRIQDAIELA